MRWLLQGRRWERAILAAITVVVGYQLFCEPIVGTADNRDYWRVMKQIGVGYKESRDPTFFVNFQHDFVIVPKEEVKYLTSEVLLGRVAVLVNDVVSKDGLFDIRVVGLVHAVAYLGAIAVFLAAFRRRARWLRCVVGVSSLLIFTDVRLVAYFNSFYCEAAQLIFLILTIGCLLHVVETKRGTWFLAFLVCAVLFLFAKSQDLPLCFPIGFIAAYVAPNKTRMGRTALATLFVGLFVWGMASDAYAVTKGINVQVTLDEEILKHSKQPEMDLAELGDGSRTAVTFVSIAKFYAHHPLRWWAVAKRRLHEAFTRTPYGNFERPLSGESKAFAGFSDWKTKHYSRWLWFWLIAICAYGALLFCRWRTGDRDARASTICNAMWVVACILEFIAVVTFEANGTEKHFFIFNVLVDLVLLLAIAEVEALVSAARSKRSDT